eukprot:CAMPEP_0197025940 /NCGR_PEP_ID=MMETSP1384-20130603/6136_1 /TAXON_ID=29189 /ORGANISM="Ammonia sp." /LENGTH=332 /DNA_ID=CAMNT_0042454531 /DNA_START=15 /DNA_END=1013 /DNA_ORIENTATION=+
MVTEQQQQNLTILSVTTSAISFIAASCIVITVFMGSRGYCGGVLKGVKVERISFHLITMVSISDAIRTFGNLFGSPPSDSALCGFQTFLKIFGGVASICWVTVISFVMFALLLYSNKWDRLTISKQRRYYHAICWSFAFLNALIPTASGFYANTSGWCFIDGSNTGILLRLFNYYLWVVLVWFLIVILYVRIWKYMRDNQFELKQVPTVRKLIYYPLIFFVCWFWSLLRRAWNVFSATGQAPVGLIGLQIFFGNLYGFANAMLYGWIVYYHLDATTQSISEGTKEKTATKEKQKKQQQEQDANGANETNDDQKQTELEVEKDNVKNADDEAQ